MGHVGFIVSHVRKLSHHLRMLCQLIGGAQHQLVQLLAVIVDNQAQSFAFLHVKMIRGEAHAVVHSDDQLAIDLTRLCTDTPGFLLGWQGITRTFSSRAMCRSAQWQHAQRQQHARSEKGSIHWYVSSCRVSGRHDRSVCVSALPLRAWLLLTRP